MTGAERRRLYARRRLTGAAVLLVALVALVATSMRGRPGVPPQEMQVQPAMPAAIAPEAPAMAASEAPMPQALDVWTIPGRYEGEVISQRVRFFPEKLLCLTFDDGPDATVTPQVLETLAEHDARATFFVLGRQARAHPDLLKAIIDGGHAIGHHSYSHADRYSAAEAADEMERTCALIEEAGGHPPTLFRPPYGILDSPLTGLAREHGHATIMWTISSADSRRIGAEVIAHNVIYTPNPGDIVLMHDGPGHAATAAALPEILSKLSASGFRFITLPELLQAWDRWLAEQPVA